MARRVLSACGRYGAWLGALTFLCASSAQAAESDVSAQASSTLEPASAADTGDSSQARALYDEAIELASAGNFEAACNKLKQSLDLHDGLGTSFHLAGCWQKIGRTASSYALFEKVAGKAHELGQTEREAVARQRMDALLPKLSRLRIELEARAPGTEVYRDEQLVPESELRKAVPVDRGTHAVRVTAEGKVPWSTRIDVDSPGTTLAVMVPALTDAPAAVPHPTSAPAKKPPPSAAPAKQSSGSGQRVVALVVGGVGAAALAGGIVAATQYQSHNADAKDICPSGTNCTPDQIAKHDEAVSDARGARTWMFVGIGVGAGALATATYLFLSAPSAAPDRRASAGLRISPLFDGRSSFGAAVDGRF